MTKIRQTFVDIPVRNTTNIRPSAHVLPIGWVGELLSPRTLQLFERAQLAVQKNNLLSSTSFTTTEEESEIVFWSFSWIIYFAT